MQLEVKNLNKKYEDFNLKDITFTLKKGSIMGFVGANGAGKSTTIKAILELLNKDSGEILFDGKKLTANLKNDIGVVFDECYYFGDLNILNIEKIQSKVYKNWDKKKFFELIEIFELPKKKAFETFSKGMKMKLNIAIALSHNAKLLILDEATTGLDPIVRNQILDMFSDFVSNKENSILMSSHIVSDLERLCDWITYIDHGSLLFSMNRDELLDKFNCIKCKEKDFEKYKEFKYHKVRDDYYFLVPPNKYKESRPATIEDIILITGGRL